MKRVTRGCLLGIGMLLLGAAGCEEQTSTVSGLVTLDGKPLVLPKGARGTVEFQAVNSHAAPLDGTLDAAGHFVLAKGSKRSAHPGDYKVAVDAVEIIGPTAENAAPTGRRLTPVKYKDIETSELRITIEAGANDDVEIPLVSDGAAKGP